VGLGLLLPARCRLTDRRKYQEYEDEEGGDTGGKVKVKAQYQRQGQEEKGLLSRLLG
jgi:hypothetical protein